MAQVLTNRFMKDHLFVRRSYLKLIYGAFLLMLLSCYNCSKYTNNINQVVTIDSFDFYEEISFQYDGLNPTKVQITGDSMFVMYYPIYNYIYLYSISKKIPLDTFYFGRHEIFSFYYLNRDSIWIFGNFNGQQNTIFLINEKLDVKKQIHLSEKIKYGNVYNLVFGENIDKNFKNYIFFSITDDSLYGLNQNKEQKYSKNEIFAYYDIQKDSIITNPKLKYPYLTSNMHYPNGLYDYYNTNFLYLNNNKFLITFCYTPTAYLWDIRANKVEKKVIRSLLIDTIIPCQIPCENNNLPMYGPVLKLNDTLFVRAYLLENKYDENIYYTILDSNLSYYGEAIISKKFPFVWDYLTNSPYNFSDYRNNVFKLLKAKPLFKKISIEELKKIANKTDLNNDSNKNTQCKIISSSTDTIHSHKNMLNYLRNFVHISDTSFSVLVLHHLGCGSCNIYVNNFILANHEFLFKAKPPFYLILVFDVQPSIEPKLKELIQQYKNKISIDTIGIYNKIHPFSSYNPRLILARNNKIIYDSISLPNSQEKQLYKLLEFYNIKFDKK
ncbi:MAG: hypothetical protein N2449_09380 [Bacteroidales bacterium]|nr:hypothetical protein [Bacteroidales bacterium]